MGTGTTPPPPQRTWTVTLTPRSGGPALHCTNCGPLPHSVGAALRRTVLAHLADHASRAVLPEHLRTCQCREDDCRRHPRHRGCDGPLLLLLTRDPHGRAWHLADTCHACAATTPNSAAVPEDRQLTLPRTENFLAASPSEEDSEAFEPHFFWLTDEEHFYP